MFKNFTQRKILPSSLFILFLLCGTSSLQAMEDDFGNNRVVQVAKSVENDFPRFSPLPLGKCYMSFTSVQNNLSYYEPQRFTYSFEIRSRLIEILLGDKDSEEQPEVHAYDPETDGEANEWSGVKSDDVQQ